MQRVIPKLLTWYIENHRDLPWRRDVTAYRIWISEIILQQTRVDQGLEYFVKFVDNFPKISDLAQADIEKVLKNWQGLGYYARARNLHEAAKQIMNDFNGEFPSNYNDIRKLKGIGDYTAAAIASFAFKLPYAAVDGNVKRVGARYFGIDMPIQSSTFVKSLTQILQKNIETTSEPDTFNQAMIELGATVCIPQNPKCNQCPLAESCFANKYLKQGELPVVQPKAKPEKWHLDFFCIEQDGKILLQKRPKDGIWGGLFEFPNTTTSENDQFPIDWMELHGLFADNYTIQSMHSFKHQLSHRTIYARCWFLCFEADNIVWPKAWILVNWKEIHNFPMHRLMLKLIDSLQKG